MAESSKTLAAGAAHNINGTTNINLVYQKVSYAGTQKRSNGVQVNQCNGCCRKGLSSAKLLGLFEIWG